MEEAPLLVLMPASLAGVDDKRTRFREIFCAILEQRQAALPDHMPCEDALVRVGVEPYDNGRDVELGSSRR